MIRHSIEIDDHSILGTKQRSEGLGDLQLVGDYSVFSNPTQSIGLVAGIKFPTGDTEEANSIGTLFEPELQPGTGSYDYLAGGVYHRELGHWDLTANAIHVFKTEGDQDFRLGDLTSTSFLLNYTAPFSNIGASQIGLDVTLQHEGKQKNAGSKVEDSGGLTLLLGPTIEIKNSHHVSLFASVLFPAMQNLGGVHQEVDLIWTAGGKFSW